MYPIANPNINRRCVNETKINGIDIPKDLIVAVDVLSVHNNSEIWGPLDTSEFHPIRFSKEFKRHPAAYLAFGLGPRNCVGIKFAYLEMKLILVKILRLYEVFESSFSPKQLHFVEGTDVRSLKEDVYVTLKKRILTE